MCHFPIKRVDTCLKHTHRYVQKGWNPSRWVLCDNYFPCLLSTYYVQSSTGCIKMSKTWSLYNLVVETVTAISNTEECRHYLRCFFSCNQRHSECGLYLQHRLDESEPRAFVCHDSTRCWWGGSGKTQTPSRTTCLSGKHWQWVTQLLKLCTFKCLIQ